MELYNWLVEHVDRTYQKGNWAGSGVLPSIDGVTAAAAGWRPHPEQHTIAEMVLHMAFWKDSVTARVRGEPWTYDRASDWRPVAATAQAWAAAQVELQRAHDRLMAALRACDPGRLMDVVGKPWWSETEPLRLVHLIAGGAHHDMYHAAQIFVLRRLATATPQTAS